jgi:hypothetical protein
MRQGGEPRISPCDEVRAEGTSIEEPAIAILAPGIICHFVTMASTLFLRPNTVQSDAAVLHARMLI